jgi:adenosine deaminase
MGDLKQIILAGFKSAFLPFHVKQQYLRTVSEELQAFPEDFAVPSAQVSSTTLGEPAQA